MAETNALTIEPDTVQRLLQVGHDIEAMSTQELRDMFPQTLSQEDVGTIGGHVLRAAESQQDEATPPSHIERQALFMIGYAALGRLDISTADSVIAYLKEKRDLPHRISWGRLEKARDSLLLT